MFRRNYAGNVECATTRRYVLCCWLQYLYFSNLDTSNCFESFLVKLFVCEAFRCRGHSHFERKMIAVRAGEGITSSNKWSKSETTSYSHTSIDKHPAAAHYRIVSLRTDHMSHPCIWKGAKQKSQTDGNRYAWLLHSKLSFPAREGVSGNSLHALTLEEIQHCWIDAKEF